MILSVQPSGKKAVKRMTESSSCTLLQNEIVKHSFVHDIPCISCNLFVIDSIKTTLDRIRSKAPEDYDRLVVQVIAFVVCEMEEENTNGMWMRLRRCEDFRRTAGLAFLASPGLVLLRKGFQTEELVALIAHELGHAATVYADYMRRGPVSEEWQWELAAAWYAYKWGFGREIARHRKNRDWGHHYAGPGKIVLEFSPRDVYCYKVTRNFVARLVWIKEGYSTINWSKLEHSVRAYLNPDEPIVIDLLPLGLEEATLVGDCSHGMSFWMLDQDRGTEDGQFFACRVKDLGECSKHLCPTQYPLRKPQVEQPGSEILGASVSIRLKDSEYPAIGEYLLVLHRNVLVGKQKGSGACSVVLTWVNAETGSICQEEIYSSEAWLAEDGVLVAAYAEIVETVEGNGVRLRLHSPVPQQDGTDSVQVYYPPEKVV